MPYRPIRPMNITSDSLRAVPVGRFAPSPTGRMHLGNVYAALVSRLSAKSRGGRWILRIEDLDPQRSHTEYGRQLEDDLQWLGLTWDEGGLDGSGESGPYRQSLRGTFYEEALRRLEATGLTYPCYCTRADIMATQAPHQSDGRVIYAGTCRPQALGGNGPAPHAPGRNPATRLYVPDITVAFDDMVCGHQSIALAAECGDFILRRGDGAWAYQLAVVIDDAAMGVTEVIRGDDLLLSAAQQIYLYRLLGKEPPRFGHIPLIVNSSGRRLSKRDGSLSMNELRREHTPEEIIGWIAFLAGLRPDYTPVSADDLTETFDITLLRRGPVVVPDSLPPLYR